jgi:hypothetical protein
MLFDIIQPNFRGGLVIVQKYDGFYTNLRGLRGTGVYSFDNTNLSIMFTLEHPDGGNAGGNLDAIKNITVSRKYQFNNAKNSFDLLSGSGGLIFINVRGGTYYSEYTKFIRVP